MSDLRYISLQFIGGLIIMFLLMVLLEAVSKL